MSITCNFDKEDCEDRKSEKMLLRVSPDQDIPADTPEVKPVKHGAYLWDLSPRRRSGKSWRDLTSVN